MGASRSVIVTSIVFLGSTTAFAAEARAAAVEEPEACFAEATPGNGSEIEIGLETSRVSGVAPLSVHFDASDTRAQGVERPFHELSYCWDFGDPESGTYETTGASKNRAKGPLAAHVFEKPGTYLVTLSARDPQGHVATRAVEIQVEDPDAVFAGDATTCFSNGGDFRGCPAGAGQVTTSSLSDLRAHLGTNRRLLLRRGDVFRGALDVNVPGPAMIGAFGEGDKPRIEGGGGRVFSMSGPNPQLEDFRLVDVDIAGSGSGTVGLEMLGKATDVLLLRVGSRNTGNAILASKGTIDYLINEGRSGQDLISRFTIQDSDIGNGSGARPLIFVSGRQIAMLGNRYHDAGEHVLRLTWVEDTVVSHNDMGGTIPTKHVVKLHGPGYNQPGIGRGQYTDRVLLSDNVFRGGVDDWTVAITPQNAQSDERIRNTIVERNLFLDGPRVSLPLTVSGEDITIRDNIMVRGQRQKATCLAVGRRGVEPASARVTVTHNTCSAPGADTTLVQLDGAASDVTVFNNLVTGTETGRVASRTPSAEGQNLFVAGDTVTPEAALDRATVTLSQASPAVDAGAAEAASAWDYAGRLRSADGDGSSSAEPDVGALEYQP